LGNIPYFVKAKIKFNEAVQIRKLFRQLFETASTQVNNLQIQAITNALWQFLQGIPWKPKLSGDFSDLVFN